MPRKAKRTSRLKGRDWAVLAAAFFSFSALIGVSTWRAWQRSRSAADVADPAAAVILLLVDGTLEFRFEGTSSATFVVPPSGQSWDWTALDQLAQRARVDFPALTRFRISGKGVPRKELGQAREIASRWLPAEID